MSKSQRIRVEDVQALLEIVNECRDLGSDVQAWRTHFFAEVAKLIHADLALGGELGKVKAGIAYSIGTTEWGWEHGFDRRGWLHALASFAENPDYSNTLSSYLSEFLKQDGVNLQRTDLIPDATWYRSAHFDEVHRTMGVDHALFCFHGIPRSHDDVSGIILYRSKHRRPFQEREKVLVQLLHQAIAPWIGGPLARYHDISANDLSPRFREVLQAMLEGESDKQIAQRLKISGFTVKQYTKMIYRHFSVTGRVELLAYWIRRGWSLLAND